MQDECGSPEGDDSTVFDAYSVFGSENLVHEESARDAVIVAQGVDELARLASLHVEHAVEAVHARVVGLDGDVYVIALVAATDDVIAQL